MLKLSTSRYKVSKIYKVYNNTFKIYYYKTDSMDIEGHPLYKSRYSKSRSKANNKTRKTVKKSILPRGLSVGRRAELRANITRRALQNARRRGKTINRSNIKIPIDSIKDVNRYLRNLTTTYEDEQNSGSNSKLLDAVSQVFDRISAEIIDIRKELPSLSGTKYPVL